MKKLSYILLLSLVAIFTSCGNDDDKSAVASLEGKLTSANSYFTSSSTTQSGYYFTDTFQDNAKLLTFTHYYSVYGTTRYLAGMTYTNSTDNKTTNSVASICGKAKEGTTYITAYSSDYTPAQITINEPSKYSFYGCWISNSTYAYNCMTTDNLSPATHFKKGSWYKVTATGYDSSSKSLGTQTIYLANYTTDNDKPASDWLWFDLMPLSKAVKIIFSVDSSDKGNYGINTSTAFCLDGITLSEK